MPSLLSSAFTPAHARHQPFVLLQSSTAQSCLPVLRHAVSESMSKVEGCTLLFCLLYPPSTFVDQSQLVSERFRLLDWTANVPGYSDDDFDIFTEMRKRIEDVTPGSLTVIIDSADTLFSDLGSLSRTEQLLSLLLSLVKSRNGPSPPSCLIVHALAPSQLGSILSQARFSSSLTHLVAHPTALITHIASAYLTPPPPLSSPEKFWRVFVPISARNEESEKLVYGSDGEGSGGSEFVVEVLVRGADGGGRRRGVDRVLEGWSGDAPCDVTNIATLKSMFTKKKVEEIALDPTQNLSFNLNLTGEQQRSRAQVPLPYVHDGSSGEKAGVLPPSAILYDPDSADDLDDDDPDEDLDI